MACIVSGFPSHIATLQFEWAWQNPHITLRIPPESRIQHAAGRRKSGQPKRPRHTVSSLLSNLHLLLRVPSFLRWPLSVRFFNPDVHESWLKMCKTAREPIRSSVPIVTDFPPDAIPDSEDEGTEIEGPKKRQKVSHGIGALGVEYEEFREHVVKAKEIFEFEREGRCAVCEEDLEHDAGIYTICPSPGCQSVTHLTCLSKHFLEDDKNTLIPTEGSCPSCNLELKWISVVKELSLRMRGQKEVEKLLRVKRARKGKATSPQAVVGSDNELSDEEVEEEEIRKIEELNPWMNSETEDLTDTMQESEAESDAGSITSIASIPKPSKTKKMIKPKKAVPFKSSQGVLKTVIEDSNWDGVIELD